MTTATVPVSQVPEFTIANSLAELKSFTEENQISVTGNKGHKVSYIAAITAHFAPQIEAVIETIEPIAAEVEPTAQNIESVAVAVFEALTSPTAIRIYRGALRTALVSAYLAVMLLVTITKRLWDLIDGEPAIVYWVKSYAKSAQGQALIGWFSECRRSAQSLPQQWVEAAMLNWG